MEIVSETPISMAELKDALVAIKQRDTELNFRAGKCEDYLNQTTTATTDRVTELKKKVQELNIPRLKDEHIIKIIDIMPSSKEELKAVLSAYTVTVNDKNIESIIQLLTENQK